MIDDKKEEEDKRLRRIEEEGKMKQKSQNYRDLVGCQKIKVKVKKNVNFQS